MAIIIKKATPPKRVKKSAEINISGKILSSVSKPHAPKPTNDKKSNNEPKINLSLYFYDVARTIPATSGYIDEYGDICLAGSDNGKRVTWNETCDENIELQELAWENRPEESDEEKTTTTRAPRIRHNLRL